MSEEIEYSRPPSIGKIIATSTKETLVIRLKRKEPVENIELGGYISIQGAKYTYICKIVDIISREVTKGTTDIQMQMDDLHEIGIKIGKLPLNILGGIAYDVTVKPIRAIPLAKEEKSIEPKTAPPVFSLSFPTYADDILKLYTQKEEEYIEIGELRGIMGPSVPVKIHLLKLMSLHSGIFAKTGSGKTLLAKIIMGHIIARKKAAALIFDMHGEYGYKSNGLKNFFKEDIIVVGLKEKVQKTKIDETMEIPRSQVTMGDVLMAVENLTDAQKRSLFVVQDKFGENKWFDKLMETDAATLITDLEGRGNIVEATLSIAQTKIKQFFDNLPFIVKTDPNSNKNTADAILDWLQREKTVIVNFGSFSRDQTVYAIATNMVARRLIELYQSKYSEDQLDSLPQVVILLEEAHRFLNKNYITSSFFGSFVREARKFKLGLFIVDQSPSKIHEEVMSQLGTQFVMQLGNENDKRMVINQSEENIGEYKGEIARLNPREGLVAGKASDFLQSFFVTEYEVNNLKKIWGLKKQAKTEKTLPKKPLGGI